MILLKTVKYTQQLNQYIFVFILYNVDTDRRKFKNLCYVSFFG